MLKKCRININGVVIRVPIRMVLMTFAQIFSTRVMARNTINRLLFKDLTTLSLIQDVEQPVEKKEHGQY